MDQIHTSHNTPVPYPTMHHFVTEMCTCVHISVTKWCIVGHLLKRTMGFVRWVSIFKFMQITWCLNITWWRHQMEAFSALLALCEGNPSVTGEFPSQRPVTRSFDVFFDLRINKLLSKHSRRRWVETPSRSLWCHCIDKYHSCVECRDQVTGKGCLSIHILKPLIT